MKSLIKSTLPLCFATFFTLFACSPIEDKPKPPHEELQNPPDHFLEETVPVPVQPVPAPDKSVWDVTKEDVSSIDESKKHIVFTFDDAPAKNLEALVGTFVRFNEKNPDCPAYATLFCNGARMNERSFPALHAAYAAGFEMGNHTYSHLDLTTLTAEGLALEIERTDELLFKVDGRPLHLLRPPYGNYNEEVKRAAKTPVISWLIDTLDWTGKSEEEIYQTVFSQKSDGAIVLMHDGFEATVSAVKRLLPDLKAAGYQVVSVSQASKINNCPLKVGGVYIRERKPQNRK